MLTISLAQPWATLVADGRKTIILVENTPEVRLLWKAEIAVHATGSWDEAAFGVMQQYMWKREFRKRSRKPRFDYPRDSVICICSSVSFRHYYDAACVHGACQDVAGRSGLTIGSVRKLDPPSPHGGTFGHDGKRIQLWNWSGQALAPDAAGQVTLF